MFSLKKTLTVLSVASATLLAAPTSVEGATITWAVWTSGTVGQTTGTASGTIAGIGSVSYTGEFEFFQSGAIWNPVTSFQGGTVSNAPGATNAGIAIQGGAGTGTNTITFSAPVLDPIIAIWSLGQPAVTSQFDFGTQPFAIQGGGPNASFGGSSIFVGGACPANTVCGIEGNGVLQLNGVFSSITFTNPVFEHYYAFTVGATAAAPSAVPEPTSLLLLGTGLIAVVHAYRRKRS